MLDARVALHQASLLEFFLFLFLCLGHAQCPGYPTELVVALDMSSDVTLKAFDKIRSTALSLLEDITIAETDCPVGARVSVVSYNSQTSYLIRFSDYRQKSQLLEAVKGVSLQRSRNRRDAGQALRFIAENVFKRIRNGKLVRKVAVLLTDGDSQDISSISTAMMKLKASDINLGVITFNEAPNLLRAVQVGKWREAEFDIYSFTVIRAKVRFLNTSHARIPPVAVIIGSSIYSSVFVRMCVRSIKVAVQTHSTAQKLPEQLCALQLCDSRLRKNHMQV